MTHFCLRLGFRALHERFTKRNQELHRTRQLYEELARAPQGGEVNETFQQIKEDMERSGWFPFSWVTLYLTN